MNKWTHANILNLLDHISKFFEKGIVSKKCLIHATEYVGGTLD